MAIGIKVIGLRKAMRGIDSVNRKIDQVLMDAAEAGARLSEKYLKRVKFSGKPIHVRSGHTRQSIHTRLFRNEIKAVVGSNAIHMGVLEEGKTIRPKRAKVLTIPLRAALTRTGRSRGGPREVGKKYDETWWHSKPGKLPILYGRDFDKVVPLFVGVKSVTIKGRHSFAKTARLMRPRIQRNARLRLDAFVKKEVGGGAGGT